MAQWPQGENGAIERQPHPNPLARGVGTSRDTRSPTHKPPRVPLGLRGLPGSNKARRIVLPDTEVLRIVKAAYEIDRAFGLLVEVLAVTGARLSQAARLTCADLQADQPDPRLMIPSSFKGRGQKKITHRPVPITPALAAALKNAKGDRPADAPLLRKRDGTAWQATSTACSFSTRC